MWADTTCYKNPKYVDEVTEKIELEEEFEEGK